MRFRLFAVLSIFTVSAAVATFMTSTNAEAAPKLATTIPYDAGLSGGDVVLQPKGEYVLQCKEPCVMRATSPSEPDAGGISLLVDFRPRPLPESYTFESAGSTRLRVIGVDGGNPGAVVYLNGKNL